MRTKLCNTCGQAKPATKKFFYRDASRTDGFEYRCKACAKSRDKARFTPERKSSMDERSKRWRGENPTYHRERYRNELAEKGKEFGVLSPKKNFYIGYVVLESGTYFKPGITSYDSMQERYEKDPLVRGKLIGTQQIDFFKFDTEEEARAMEKEFLSHCQIIMGSPSVGLEWWKTK